MQLREINLGCFGGGTGLPSLLGGLKRNPWLRLNAVVTMFDSGGSSGQLRDELGVLPPGDVLRCALALARNEGEARRVLLARLPTLEHARLGGHTGGNLLLSMMEQYSGDFLAAVDGLRALLGLPRPRLAGQRRAGDALRRVRRRRRSRAARSKSTRATRAAIRSRASGSSRRRTIHPAVREAIAHVRRRHHRPGQLLHQPDADAARGRRAPRRWPAIKGPIILVSNLLTEGRGHARLHRRRRGELGQPHDRPAGGRGDRQHRAAVGRSAGALSRPNTSSRSQLGDLPAGTRSASSGDFWRIGHRAPRSPPAVVRGVGGAQQADC